MFVVGKNYLLIICVLIDVKLIFCDCEKSYISLCEDLEDIKKYKGKLEWTELAVQPKRSGWFLPKRPLTSTHLDESLYNLKWLFIVNQFDGLKNEPFVHLRANLKYLLLYGNNIRTLRSKSFQEFKKLKKLSLERNSIFAMDPRVFDGSNIDVLDLSHNRLSSIRYGRFQNCTILELIIQDNILVSISPNSLPRSLKILRLDGNNFESLASSALINLDQLEEFTISHNRFSGIFDLSGLKLVKRLDLSYNQIRFVSDELDQLENLEHLDLTRNQLRQVTFTPAFIQGTHYRLQVYLAFNQLRNLEVEQISERKIITLTLFGNPWNCKCLDEMESFMSRNYILKTGCDKMMVGSGKAPVCVNSEGECTDEELPRDVLQRFEASMQNITCDMFEDVDILEYKTSIFFH